MDGADVEETPIWRTGLATLLAAWIALTVLAIVGWWRLAEEAPLSLLMAAPVTLILMGVFLLVALLWAMFRDPATGWMGPAAFLLFLSGMIPAFGPLSDLGVKLNFESHRPAYDEVIADARAGRLPTGPGWTDVTRGGLRYRYNAARPGVIDFVWVRDELVAAGVRYTDIVCTPTAGVRCIDRGRPLGDHYFHYWRLF